MLFTSNKNEDDSSLAISDLMTALMGTFLIGSVVAIELKSSDLPTSTIEMSKNFVARGVIFNDHFENVTERFTELHLDTKNFSLKNRFKFSSGKSLVSEDMSEMLDKLCPLLIEYTKNNDDIKKVIFRGHTDKSWSGEGNKFIGNMEVSYMRAINTLKHCLKNFDSNETKIASKFIAQGHSFVGSLYKKTKRNNGNSRFVEIIFQYKVDKD